MPSMGSLHFIMLMILYSLEQLVLGQMYLPEMKIMKRSIFFLIMLLLVKIIALLSQPLYILFRPIELISSDSNV